jgi:TolA-binding protein
MADEDPEVEPTPDPDAGAKKALEAERKARRDAEKQLKDIQAQVKQLEDADKSESERLTERLAEAEKRATAAEGRADRFEVALEKGLDMTRAKRLTGSTREELEADADELHTWQAGSNEGPAPSKPTEALTGGGDPTEDAPVDIRQVVDAIPRGF